MFCFFSSFRSSCFVSVYSAFPQHCISTDFDCSFNFFYLSLVSLHLHVCRVHFIVSKNIKQLIKVKALLPITLLFTTSYKGIWKKGSGWGKTTKGESHIFEQFLVKSTGWGSPLTVGIPICSVFGLYFQIALDI